jgi:hypothetical protein
MAKFEIMKRRSISLSIVLTLFVSISYCQQLPNFSGDWVLNLSKSKLQADWTSGLTNGIFKIVHNEPNFSFWRSFTIKGKDKVAAYEIPTNGQEQKGKHKTIWSLSWKQDTLVLVVRRHEMTIDSVRYSLSTDKMKFFADERVDIPKSYHNHWVFDKKSQMNN